MTKDKVKPELLPCPFCGRAGNDLFFGQDHSEEYNNRVYAYHVECHCGARGRNLYPICWVETEDHAIEAWNDRFIPATIPGTEEDRVQITTDALLHIRRELERIDAIKKHIDDLLTPIKMV